MTHGRLRTVCQMKPSLDSPAKLRCPVGLVPSQGISSMNAADAAAAHRSFVVRSQVVVILGISPPHVLQYELPFRRLHGNNVRSGYH